MKLPSGGDTLRGMVICGVEIEVNHALAPRPSQFADHMDILIRPYKARSAAARSGCPAASARFAP